MESKSLIIENILEAPIQKVWNSITSRDEMKAWYFDLAEFRPEVGFEFRFEGGPEGRTYLHICKITEVIMGRKITYSWRYDGYDGISYVTFELFDQGNTTRLKLTHNGLNTFPPENPDFNRKNFVEGWTHFIKGALPGFLSSK